jgi:hypothetical protein
MLNGKKKIQTSKCAKKVQLVSGCAKKSDYIDKERFHGTTQNCNEERKRLGAKR